MDYRFFYALFDTQSVTDPHAAIERQLEKLFGNLMLQKAESAHLTTRKIA